MAFGLRLRRRLARSVVARRCVAAGAAGCDRDRFACARSARPPAAACGPFPLTRGVCAFAVRSLGVLFGAVSVAAVDAFTFLAFAAFAAFAVFAFAAFAVFAVFAFAVFAFAALAL